MDETLSACGHDRELSWTKRDRHIAIYEVALALMIGSKVFDEC